MKDVSQLTSMLWQFEVHEKHWCWKISSQCTEMLPRPGRQWVWVL